MSRKVRLDVELVRRHLVASRNQARRLIEEGKVLVAGLPAGSPATQVAPDARISLASPPSRFVSRGGDKLDGALARLDVEVAGRRWLDAGASTGGFTDRLLQGGAAHVVAVDVGYGQLDWTLREDERVTVLERTNVRMLSRDRVPGPVEGVVADLSFISLRLVLPALVSVAEPDADHVVLVKPQFEVGREAVGRSGVVRDPELWIAAMEGVAGAASLLGLGVANAVPSPLEGPAGNHEFFLHLRHGPGDHEVLAAAAHEVTR